MKAKGVQPRAEVMDPPTARALKLWVVLARAAAALEEHDKASVAAHGLTRGEFAVLEALLHKGPMLLRDVRSRILVSSGGITYLVDRLAEQGLVERRICPSDRRAFYVHLTDAGRSMIEEVFPPHARRIRAALAGLSAAEQRRATDLLRKLGRYAAETPPALPEYDARPESDGSAVA
ncbi:MAG TPA: MarR family transcriptional regulator [Longimicrobiales bacterium]|nr:MarR family transcriptional regulator [Longimicrobiales bacterium]